jgi:predicted ester cyclase
MAYLSDVDVNIDATTRRLEEIVTTFRKKAFIQRDFDAIDEHLTSDFIDHFAPPWDPPGVEGVKRRFGQAASAFQTTQVEVVLSMSKGSVLMQAIRIHLRHTGEFMGLPASGREITIGGFDAFEFRGTKLAAHWGVYDVSRIPDLLGMTPALLNSKPSASWASMWSH